MLDVFRQLIVNQYEAALCTLDLCIDRCPANAWNEPVFAWKFCQAAFHTLFFTDVYLGKDEDSLKRQPFHLENDHVFRDYEEMLPREPVLLYEKEWIRKYLQHCRKKVSEVLAAETAESLSANAGFGRHRYRDYTRAELHVCNIRHIQHHAAQLSLRLRIDSKVDIPWVGSGWREV